MSDRPDDPKSPTPKSDPKTTEDVKSVSPTAAISWGLILFLLLAVALVVFTWQNTQPIELRFLGWNWEIPLAILIIGVAVFSVVLDEILGLVLRRRRRQRAEDRAELARLRKNSQSKPR